LQGDAIKGEEDDSELPADLLPECLRVRGDIDQ
jgi:hypothetical protein